VRPDGRFVPHRTWDDTSRPAEFAISA
jgi:hypothetical protein